MYPLRHSKDLRELNKDGGAGAVVVGGACGAADLVERTQLLHPVDFFVAKREIGKTATRGYLLYHQLLHQRV